MNGSGGVVAIWPGEVGRNSMVKDDPLAMKKKGGGEGGSPYLAGGLLCCECGVR